MLNSIGERIFKTGRLRGTALTQLFRPLNTYPVAWKENRRISISAVASAHPTGVRENVTHGLSSVGLGGFDIARVVTTMTPNRGHWFQNFLVLIKNLILTAERCMGRGCLALMVPDADAGTVMRSLSKEHR